MHTLMDGITRNEGAWMLQQMCKNGFLDWDEFMEEQQRYTYSSDVRVPLIKEKVKVGLKNGTPRHDATLGLSASQTLEWALHR